MRTCVIAVAVALVLTATASAAEPGKIAVEFNDLQAGDAGCRAVFVLNNGLEQPLSKLALRVVAFDKEQHAKLFSLSRCRRAAGRQDTRRAL